jgi:SAM-dependent methyltransferase
MERATNPDVVCDLGKERWPFENSVATDVRASHVLEHLPGESFFHFMREMYRVCAPGAKVEIVVPHPRHDLFLNDPTHYRPITPTLLALFSREVVDEAAGALTPFAHYNGVDFRQIGVVYGIDGKLPPDILEKVQANLAFYEKYVSNTIVEIFVEMEAVK